MAEPDFSSDTVELLAFRSALVCNNPDCKKLTVGPSKVANPLKLLVGEAAHICAARAGKKNPQARYVATMSDAQRADFANGIWLCASCHTMVDKNSGADFSIADLRAWKEAHESAIRLLFISQQSPFPYLRQYAIESQVAQDIVDMFETRGVLFVDVIYEVDQHVITSLEVMRQRLDQFLPLVKHDALLKAKIVDIANDFGHVMNVTGNFPSDWRSELEALRLRLAQFLRVLEREYGCKITGKLRKILK